MTANGEANNWEASEFVVIDLEATCDDNRMTIPLHESETIEIGAVKMNAAYEVTSEFCEFIQPVLHPQLTSYCTELTTIEQSDVDQAHQLPIVLQRFLDWVGPPPKWFISWGDYDRRQMQRDCERHQLQWPQWMTSRHCNLQMLSTFGRGPKPSLAEALSQRGLTMDGTAHRGIDDAKNTAKLVPYILGPKRFEGRLKAQESFTTA